LEFTLLEHPNQKSWLKGSRRMVACQAVTASCTACRVLPPHPLVLAVQLPQLPEEPPGPYPVGQNSSPSMFTPFKWTVHPPEVDVVTWLPLTKRVSGAAAAPPRAKSQKPTARTWILPDVLRGHKFQNLILTACKCF
jgi:hypothetical protein